MKYKNKTTSTHAFDHNRELREGPQPGKEAHREGLVVKLRDVRGAVARLVDVDLARRRARLDLLRGLYYVSSLIIALIIALN